jgi:2-oxoglutarate ferredoxin oxidoreductase subunit beta
MTKTFTPARPIWCAGCGDFGVQSALVNALDHHGIAAHDVMVLAGIGCAGTIQNNLSNYGYHAMHGRVLPTATGVVLTNPELTVIAAGGDGDGYAIGGGHLVHTFKRNPSMVYIVMNNGTYGLTKGQDSPTVAQRRNDYVEQAIDAVALGLAVPGSTFIARAFTRWPDQMQDLMIAALEHARSKRGFAFLEIMSPCVTYNDTYPAWEVALDNLDERPDYDPTDRVAAFGAVTTLAAEGRMAAGMIYRGDNTAYEAAWQSADHAPPALQDVEPGGHVESYRAILERYGV